MNDFPRMNINTADLMAHVSELLEMAAADRSEMGAVNWSDLGVEDIQYRLSMLYPQNGPHCIVTVDEASPGCKLQQWLNERLDAERFPNTYIECEW